MENVESVDAEKDPEFKNALDDVLGFYGMQLKSHAATLVGLSIAIFALFSLRPGDIVVILGSALAISLLITGAGFTALRLLVYGALSRTILYGNFRTVNRFANVPASTPEWTGALPQCKVSFYTQSFFNEIWRNKIHLRVLEGKWFVNEKHQPRALFLLIIWAGAFTVTILFSFLT